MSCMMMNHNALYALADTVAAITTHGFNYFGFEAPRSLYDALQKRGCVGAWGNAHTGDVYAALYRLNLAAYNGRYPDHTDPAEALPIPAPIPATLYRPLEWVDYYASVQPWHYHLAKLLSFYTYQTAEDATNADTLRLALVELERILCAFIVQHSTEWSAAPWGTI